MKRRRNRPYAKLGICTDCGRKFSATWRVLATRCAICRKTSTAKADHKARLAEERLERKLKASTPPRKELVFLDWTDLPLGVATQRGPA